MSPFEQVINHFGSASNAANALNITYQAVNKWEKHPITSTRAAMIEQATKGALTIEKLCPEVFAFRNAATSSCAN